MDRLLRGLAFLLGVTPVAGIVGGVWLAVQGEWWAVGLGVVAALFGNNVLSMALFPTALLDARSVTVSGARGGRSVGSLVSLFYTATVATVWCVGVVVFFMAKVDEHNWIAFVLFSIGVGSFPWGYLAWNAGEAGGGDLESVLTSFIYLAMVLVGLLLLSDRLRPQRDLWVTFSLTMMCAVFMLARMRATVALRMDR